MEPARPRLMEPARPRAGEMALQQSPNGSPRRAVSIVNAYSKSLPADEPPEDFAN
jgi:hypothetical protein